ncbi:hypothetical protein ABK040_014506 [Willaertia magna]
MSSSENLASVVDNTFIYCYSSSEPKQMTLPENTKIKSITANSTTTIILTELNELIRLEPSFGETLPNNVFFSKFKGSDKLFQFNFTHFVKEILKLKYIPKIKEIFSIYNIIILQLENDEYILMEIIDENNVTGLYIKDNFKIFATCPLSQRFIAINKNNKFKCWQIKIVKQKRCIKSVCINEKAQKIIDKLLIEKGIKILTCGGDFSVIVTNDNKMYFEGPNTYNSQSGIQTEEFEYTYLKTPFEEMSEIKQVKCGYYHTIVLLNNGKVFATGYNILKQCGQNSADDSQTFLEFKLPIGLQVKEIGCNSRGTYFTTINTDKVYFVGEVFEDKKDEQFGDVTAHCFNLQYSTNLKFNTVVAGGWHYIVYHKNLKESKSLIYFKNNLQSLTTTNSNFIDIYLFFNE